MLDASVSQSDGHDKEEHNEPDYGMDLNGMDWSRISNFVPLLPLQTKPFTELLGEGGGWDPFPKMSRGQV